MYRSFSDYIRPSTISTYSVEMDYEKTPIKVGDKILFFIEQLQWYRVIEVNKKSFRIQRKMMKNIQEIAVKSDDIGVCCFLSIDHFKESITNIIQEYINEHKEIITKLKNKIEDLEDDY